MRVCALLLFPVDPWLADAVDEAEGLGGLQHARRQFSKQVECLRKRRVGDLFAPSRQSVATGHQAEIAGNNEQD